MLFIVKCQDKENQKSIRDSYSAAHKDFLSKYKDYIIAPGTLYEEEGGVAQGSIWIVEAKDKEEVQAICAKDPFLINGLRKSVDIFIWNKVFPETKNLI